MADNITRLQRDPGGEQSVQPDPMLQTKRPANPIAVGVAAVFGLVILCVVFYGLTRSEGPQTASTSTSAPSTSGQANSSDAAGPSPADQANTAAHGTGNNQSSGPQPANQGQGDAAGPTTNRPGGE